MKCSIGVKAYRLICNELSKFENEETGGILLGYTNFDVVNIVMATDSGYINDKHDFNFCEYDVDYQSHICNIISNLYPVPLRLIGVWHKHNYFSENPLSKTDIDVLKKYVIETNGTCVSLLMQKINSEEYSMDVFYLKNNSDRISKFENIYFQRDYV